MANSGGGSRLLPVFEFPAITIHHCKKKGLFGYPNEDLNFQMTFGGRGGGKKERRITIAGYKQNALKFFHLSEEAVMGTGM